MSFDIKRAYTVAESVLGVCNPSDFASDICRSLARGIQTALAEMLAESLSAGELVSSPSSGLLLGAEQVLYEGASGEVVHRAYAADADEALLFRHTTKNSITGGLARLDSYDVAGVEKVRMDLNGVWLHRSPWYHEDFWGSTLPAPWTNTGTGVVQMSARGGGWVAVGADQGYSIELHWPSSLAQFPVAAGITTVFYWRGFLQENVVINNGTFEIGLHAAVGNAQHGTYVRFDSDAAAIYTVTQDAGGATETQLTETGFTAPVLEDIYEIFIVIEGTSAVHFHLNRPSTTQSATKKHTAHIYSAASLFPFANCETDYWEIDTDAISISSTANKEL